MSGDSRENGWTGRGLGGREAGSRAGSQAVAQSETDDGKGFHSAGCEPISDLHGSTSLDAHMPAGEVLPRPCASSSDDIEGQRTDDGAADCADASFVQPPSRHSCSILRAHFVSPSARHLSAPARPSWLVGLCLCRSFVPFLAPPALTPALTTLRLG